MTKNYSVCGEVAAGNVTRTLSATLNVASGASGTIVTLTPPSGQRVRLSTLHSVGAGNETGVTININGAPVISGVTLANGNPDSFPAVGELRIGSSYPTVQFIDGGTDETIAVVKDTGSTTSTVVYAYQYLE